MKAKNDNEFSEMQAEILRKRHLWKDKYGKVIETNDQMSQAVPFSLTSDSKGYRHF